ncbi:MAG: ribosome maturation factor RimP, partial [Dethiobacteria bacterium]|jgi:ribosome maturation factor RimP|nr:ribosome maturation factor RimP [Bacillota bacterium]
MDTKAITAKIEGHALPIVESLGYELVDLELKKESGRWFLRFYIDKPEGITIGDCELVNRKLDHLLDQIDPIPVSFNLEVSSPGIERPLKKVKDFERFRGREVKLKTFTPLDGQKNFIGILQDSNKEFVTILETGGEKEREIKIPLGMIAKANLYFRP